MFKKILKTIKLLFISVEIFDKQINQYKIISKEPALPSYAYINWGLFLIRSGKNKKGIEKFNQSILMNKSNPESYLNLGVTFAQSGMFNEALKNFKKAVRLDPNNAKAWSFLASAYSETDENDLAESAFEKSIKLDRLNSGTYLNYGIFSIKNSKKEQAKSMFKKAYLLDPTLGQALFMWGVTLIQENDYKGARSKFLKFLELEPFNSEALYFLGLCFARLKKYTQCIEFCKKSAGIDPNKTDNYLLISESYLNLNKKEECYSTFENAENFCKKDWRFYHSWGLAYQYFNDFENSVEKFNKGIELNQNDVGLLNALSYSLIRLDKKSEAKDAIQDALKIDLNSPSCYFNLGQILLKQEKYSEAIDSFKKSVTLDATLTYAYYYIALCYEKLKDLTNAIKYWQKAVEYDKQNINAYVNLAMAYLESDEIQDNKTKAIRYIRSAYEQNKESSDINFKYGLVLWRTGDIYRAIEKFEEAYKLDNNNIKSQMMLAECYLKLQKFEKVKEILEKFESQKGEDEDFLLIKLMLLNNEFEKNPNSEELMNTILQICDKILSVSNNKTAEVIKERILNSKEV